MVELNSDIELTEETVDATAEVVESNPPRPVPESTAGNSLAKDWSVPTQPKTPGASAATDKGGGEDPKQEPDSSSTKSADFDHNIEPEKEPEPKTELGPDEAEERKNALNMYATIGAKLFDKALTGLSSLALHRSTFNAQDRRVLRLLLNEVAEQRRKKGVITEYEEWLLSEKAKFEYFKQNEAPLSPEEIKIITDAAAPCMEIWLKKFLGVQPTPEGALAFALLAVSTPRLAPSVGKLAGNFFFSDKPPYAQATDVTNE